MHARLSLPLLLRRCVALRSAQLPLCALRPLDAVASVSLLCAKQMLASRLTRTQRCSAMRAMASQGAFLSTLTSRQQKPVLHGAVRAEPGAMSAPPPPPPQPQQHHGKKRRHHAAPDVQQQPTSHAHSSAAAAAAAPAASMTAAASSSSSVPPYPRTLHVLEFAEARSREIASLTSVLAAGGGGGTSVGGLGALSSANPAQISGGGRRVFQSLPRHMRRRAMSHNIKRLPLRLQPAAQREMDKIARSAPAGGASSAAASGEGKSASKPPSRRTRRRPRNILALHAHRQGRHQWLETHLWHAKRFRMANEWGYKMPMNPSDRSLRACYNAGVHLATIYDASFMQVIALRASEVRSIAALMRAFVPPRDLQQLMSVDVCSGRRETQVRLHLPGAAPYGFIALAKCQWQAHGNSNKSTNTSASSASATAAAAAASSSSSHQLWLWLHPSIYALVQSLLSHAAAAAAAASSSSGTVHVEPLLGELCRIELRGHRCQAVMRMVIRAIEKVETSGATPVAATAAAAAGSKAETKDDAAMSDVGSASATATDSSSVPSIASFLATYVSPCQFPAHSIYACQVQHPEKLRGGLLGQPFSLVDATREKQRGSITTKRNATFSKENDAKMHGKMKKEHHAMLFGNEETTTKHTAASAPSASAASASGSGPSMPAVDGPLGCVSPLFDSSFRRAHTRETLWGAKKQRYARIARRETERKRKMHERRAEETASAIVAATAADDSDEEAGAASDTTASKRRAPTKQQSKQAAAAAAKRSKDDLDIGSSSTPLSSATSSSPLPAAFPLSNQPYLMLIQQPGVSFQASAGSANMQVNSASHSLGSGWDIVCCSGWAVLLWKALVFCGVRAIGARDHAAFAHELGRIDAIAAPEDFPDSAAGQTALLFRTRTRCWHADRIPPNKKPNFTANHVARPFACAFAETLGMETQESMEARYAALIVKPHPENRRYEANLAAEASEAEADDEAAAEEKEEKDASAAPRAKKAKHSNDSSSSSTKKPQTAENANASMEDVPATSLSVAVVTAAAPPLSSRIPKRKTKRLPLPETEPPYELLPVPEDFFSRSSSSAAGGGAAPSASAVRAASVSASASVSSVSPHLSMYVWRDWYEEWMAQRAAVKGDVQPSSLLQFLTSPAAPPLSTVLLPVQLRCPSGGRPEDAALISAPLAEDLARFRSRTPAPAAVPDPEISLHPNHPREDRTTSWDVLQERINKLKHPVSHRATQREMCRFACLVLFADLFSLCFAVFVVVSLLYVC